MSHLGWDISACNTEQVTQGHYPAMWNDPSFSWVQHRCDKVISLTTYSGITSDIWALIQCRNIAQHCQSLMKFYCENISTDLYSHQSGEGAWKLCNHLDPLTFRMTWWCCVFKYQCNEKPRSRECLILLLPLTWCTLGSQWETDPNTGRKGMPKDSERCNVPLMKFVRMLFIITIKQEGEQKYTSGDRGR